MLSEGVGAEALGLVGLDGLDFRDRLGTREERRARDTRGDDSFSRPFIGLDDAKPRAAAPEGLVPPVWQFIDLEGNTVLSTNSYVELATGLNYFDDTTGQWRPAKPEFELTRTGHFIARQTQHQLILSPELNQQGAVDLLAPDGVRLRSTILGLALVDPDRGKSALLAQLKPTQPQWIAPDQVLYADAFDTVAADVRYSIGLDRFKQDIILRQ